MRRNYLKFAAVVASVALASGCAGGGSASSGSDINFVLNFAASGFHAGFASAVERGYYKKDGLNVKLEEGQGSTTTAQLVASGKVDIAYADAAAVMPLIAKGAPMKIVSTITQVSPNQVSALKEKHLTSVADLRGKSLGVPSGSSQLPMVPILLQHAGLTEKDLKIVNLPATSLVPSLLQKKVDAILGSRDAYGIQIAQQGGKTDDYLMADNGVPTVSVSIIVRNDYLKKNPKVVKEFVADSLRGWDYAIDHQDDAIKDLQKVFPSVKAEQAAAELEVTPPLFCRGDAKYIGKAEPAHWAEATQLLEQVGLLPAGTNPKEFYTYDYLPPESQMRKCNA